MILAIWLILAGIICIIALVATLKVGYGEEDKEYSSDRSLKNLLKMYLYTFPLVFVGLLIYWAFF